MNLKLNQITKTNPQVKLLLQCNTLYIFKTTSVIMSMAMAHNRKLHTTTPLSQAYQMLRRILDWSASTISFLIRVYYYYYKVHSIQSSRKWETIARASNDLEKS